MFSKIHDYINKALDTFYEAFENFLNRIGIF